MNSICLPEYSSNCDFYTYIDMTLDVSSNFPTLSPNSATLFASSMANLNLLYSSVKDSFSVIFDTGAILAISFDKNDFVGPIITLSNHRLGG